MRNASDTVAYRREDVEKIIKSVVEKVGGAGDISRQVLRDELENLQDIIQKAWEEIGLTNPGEIRNKHIPSAADELEAVVGATEEATGIIMDACDVISDKVSSLEQDAQKNIMNEVTKIYEACSFQDITGQRITKVVRTLSEIQIRIDRLAKILGNTGAAKPEEDTRTGDEKLLNGPQMPDKAITQDDIDALLSSFDE